MGIYVRLPRKLSEDRLPIILPEYALIPITAGGMCKVDIEDVEKVSFRWQAKRNSNGVYAQRTVMRKTQLMHRFIIDAADGQIVDHINRDTLDNRKSNLRIATESQNQANRVSVFRPGKASRYKGVSRSLSLKNPWQASIRANGKQYNLGLFPTEEAAAMAYDSAALDRFGEFARINNVLAQDHAV